MKNLVSILSKRFMVYGLWFMVFLLFTIFYIPLTNPVHAQDPGCPAAPAAATTLPPEDTGSIAIMQFKGIEAANWQCDQEVTFSGKLAARSQDTLNWLLQNYSWSKTTEPFDKLVQFIVFTVYAILGLFILAGAFLLIITRGRSLTVRRFIIRFIFVVVFVFFAFSIVRTIYWLADILQGFFITIDGKAIQTKDLLNVAFKYQDFVGYRRIGAAYHESAIISLILVKLTAATYYTMFFILVIRKIILWFFILVSPIFPLLLFFRPIRNTAKIWIGEFFRWVLYAPLFAVFLRGLVEIWKFGVQPGINKTGVPLGFELTQAGTAASLGSQDYPTAINILLGGPGISVLGNNSINYSDTFVLYLVALAMLWMVIILPWILLRIFLDYFNNYSFGDSGLMKYMRNSSPLSPLGGFRSPVGSPPVGPVPPIKPPPGAAGLARSMPMTRFKHTPVTEIQQSMQQAEAKQRAMMNESVGNITATANAALSGINAQSNLGTGQMIASSGSLKIPDLQTQQITADLLNLTNLPIPTMKDIAKYETAMLQKGGSAEVNKISEMLSRLSGTSPVTSPQEKEHFSRIKEKLVVESNKGNAVAKSMNSAASPVTGSSLPEDNNVQQVNLDDYEEVKKTWQENYKKLEPPVGVDGKVKDRKEWLQEEVKQIPTVIDLLLSGDPQKVEQGKKMVSRILPFLLLGGFSKAEIVAYLKAKLEAAKGVLNEALQVEAATEEEDSKVEVDRTKHAAASAHLAAEINPEDEKKEIAPNQNSEIGSDPNNSNSSSEKPQ